jgi:hypothetical protein
VRSKRITDLLTTMYEFVDEHRLPILRLFQILTQLGRLRVDDHEYASASVKSQRRRPADSPLPLICQLERPHLRRAVFAPRLEPGRGGLQAPWTG